MNSGTQFEPYDRDYESGYRYHGKANYNAILSTFITQPQMGQTFGEDTFPYICYAYDSINNKIVHVGSVSWADEKLTISIAPVSNDGYIKHFLACTSDCPVSDLIGDTDRITNLRFNQNLQRYNPLDIDFQWTRFGLQAGVINTETLQKSVVNSIDELKALDSSKYVVEYTKCRNFYKDTRTDDWGGFVDYDNTVSLVNNCNDTVLYCRGKGTNNVRYGINVVPRFGIGANTQGQPTYADVEYHSADTGIELIGLDWNEYNEIVIPTNNIFNYLDNGGVMQVTSAGSDYKNLDYRLTIEQTLKELAFTGLIFCNNDDPHSNLYAGYIDPDGLATGELIPYEDWEKTDSLNVKNKFMTDFPDLHIKPKPTPEPSDEDEIDDMKLGVGNNYIGMVKYYRLSPAQLLLFSQEIQKESVVPAGYDILKNIVALKRYPTKLTNYAEFSDAEFIKLGSVTVPVSASPLAWEKRNISLGEYTIQGYHGTKENPHFLDFSPYTTAEIFIPYCGFISLPVDKIMYNTIEVRFLVDVKLGNCNGVVKCNGNIVGEKTGIIGSDIPLVAVNMGVLMGAITQGLMDTTIGFVSAIPYAAAGNTAATFSGVLNGTSALTQTIMSSKKNYTEVVGTTGGDIMFSMPDRCYIKLTYPKKDLPDNYGKMVGYMCGKGGRLGDFNGFTICENAHINVKATDEEKRMILEKLLTGVIMPYNG